MPPANLGCSQLLHLPAKVFSIIAVGRAPEYGSANGSKTVIMQGLLFAIFIDGEKTKNRLFHKMIRVDIDTAIDHTEIISLPYQFIKCLNIGPAFNYMLMGSIHLIIHHFESDIQYHPK